MDNNGSNTMTLEQVNGQVGVILFKSQLVCGVLVTKHQPTNQHPKELTNRPINQPKYQLTDQSFKQTNKPASDQTHTPIYLPTYPPNRQPTC